MRSDQLPIESFSLPADQLENAPPSAHAIGEVVLSEVAEMPQEEVDRQFEEMIKPFGVEIMQEQEILRPYLDAEHEDGKHGKKPPPKPPTGTNQSVVWTPTDDNREKVDGHTYGDED